MTIESLAPAVPPAVGEKNKLEFFGGVPAFLSDANGFDGLELPVGAADRRSSDMVEFPPTTLYMPRFLPGVASMVFWSARFCACAARWTDLCSDHATMPRQIKTANIIAPKAAPTHMNTVPSGRLDFCMNGAMEVSGTTMSGTPTPANVGKSEGCVTVESTVLVGFVAAVSELEAALVVAAAVVELAPSGCDTVERFGRSVPVSFAASVVFAAAVVAAAFVPTSCAMTAGARNRRRPTRPVEGRMAKNGVLMRRKVRVRRAAVDGGVVGKSRQI